MKTEEVEAKLIQVRDILEEIMFENKISHAQMISALTEILRSQTQPQKAR